MAKPFNLLVFPSNPTDATSFYRAMGPLAHLRKEVPGLEIHMAPQVTWMHMAMMDGVLMQRPHREIDFRIARQAFRAGLPIWSEFDDDIFNIPTDNPAFDVYMKPESKAAAAGVVAMSHTVTVSTGHLKTIFDRMHPHVMTIPNALMTNIVGRIPRHHAKKRTDAVLWRGGSSHQRDLDTMTPQIIRAMKANPSFTICFQGFHTYELMEQLGEQARRGVMQDPIDYFGALPNLCPKVVIVPLTDNTFNRSKSNIAWIEATFAGAVCVAPDWPEWQRPGVINYRDAEDFERKMSEAIQMSDEHQDHRWRESFDYITKKLTIDETNKPRALIVNQLRAWREDPSFSDRQRRDAHAPPPKLAKPTTTIVENFADLAASL